MIHLHGIVQEETLIYGVGPPGTWFVSTVGSVHLQAIINCVEPSKSILHQLQAKGCKTDIVVYWVSSGQGGPELEVQTMRAFTELNLAI